MFIMAANRLQPIYRIDERCPCRTCLPLAAVVKSALLPGSLTYKAFPFAEGSPDLIAEFVIFRRIRFLHYLP
jgi:hypothetical protein